MNETYHVRLPMPPSINEAYADVPMGKKCRRVSSKTLREWKKVAKAFVESQEVPKAEGSYAPGTYRVELTLAVYMHGWQRDMTNVIKLAEDFLADWFAFDDRYVTNLHTYRIEAPSKGETKIHATIAFRQANT
jgi:Holliday junction resolvase RusA-like endonuclease